MPAPYDIEPDRPAFGAMMGAAVALAYFAIQIGGTVGWPVAIGFRVCPRRRDG